MYKRLLATVMSVLLTVTVLPQNVYAEDAEETAEGIITETEETGQEEEIIPKMITEVEGPDESEINA